MTFDPDRTRGLYPKFLVQRTDYVHLLCLDHNPPVFSDEEVGQHLYDLPQIRQDIANRDLLVKAWRAEAEPDERFRRTTVRFLASHPNCNIGIRDEYGVDHPLVEEPPAPQPWEHEGHKPVQHRDRKPPWCDVCGWSSPIPAQPAVHVRDLEARPLSWREGDRQTRAEHGLPPRKGATA